jgi:hypothetical protein
MNRTLVTALLAVTAAVLAACVGGSDPPRVATQASNQSLTGEPGLDHTLGAVLVPDTIAMAGLTGYQKVACATTADAGHPACRADEHPGMPVEVLLTLGCSSTGWVRPEIVPDVYATALKDKQPRLTAVYTPTAGVQFVRFGTEYVAIIATRRAGGGDAAVALYIKGGRIVALEDDCGNPQGLLDSARIGAWVVRPPG